MFLLVLMNLGVAGGLSEALEKSRKSFLSGKYSEMDKSLAQAKQSLSSTNEIVKPEELAFMTYLSSLALAKKGFDPLDLWRKTFAIYDAYEGEADLFESKEQADLFMAVRMEMEYAEKKTAYIPQKYGLAKIYIDGQEKQFEDMVIPGRHFLQIRCPKGEIVSKFHTLEEDPQWLSMCPYEIDVNASNNDDPFSLDGIDDGFDTENSQEENIVEEAPPQKEEPKPIEVKEEKSAEPTSYFSGVKVQKMTAKPTFWGGIEGGVFTDETEVVRFHGDGILLYQLEELELELHAGVQLSGGVNYILTEGAMLGVHAGYHILHGDVLLDARFRKEIQISEGIRGYSRVRFGYQYSWKRVFGGVDLGLVVAIF